MDQDRFDVVQAALGDPEDAFVGIAVTAVLADCEAEVRAAQKADPQLRGFEFSAALNTRLDGVISLAGLDAYPAEAREWFTDIAYDYAVEPVSPITGLP